MNNIFFTVGNSSYQLEKIAFAEYVPATEGQKNQMLILHMATGEKVNLFKEKADVLWDAIKASSLTLV